MQHSSENPLSLRIRPDSGAHRDRIHGYRALSDRVLIGGVDEDGLRGSCLENHPVLWRRGHIHETGTRSESGAGGEYGRARHSRSACHH